MKKLPLTILGLLVLSSILFFPTQATESNSVRVTPSLFPSLALTDHAAIEIANDGDFTGANGVISGTGIELDPYIIEGWNVTVATGHGIYVHDTSAFFIIRNCFVDAGEEDSYPNYDSGIFVNYTAVGTVTVEDNTVVSSSRGIRIEFADNVLVVNNTCSNNLNAGIYAYISFNLEVANNSCSENEYGLYLYTSSYYNVMNNSLTSNLVGLYCNSVSNYGNVSENTCNDNLNGLSIAGKYSTINNNVVNRNTNRGIYSTGFNNTIANNTCLNNGNYGIYHSSGINLVITNNTIVNGGFYISLNSISDYINTIVENNKVNGLPLGWFVNQYYIDISEDYGQLYIINSSKISISEQNFSDLSTSIFILNSNESYIQRNSFSNMMEAIIVSDSLDIEINRNEFTNMSKKAIYIDASNETSIADNSITNVLEEGIYIDGSLGSTIQNNVFANITANGIYLDWSNINFVANNTIFNHDIDANGINLIGCDNSTVVDNYFWNTLEENQAKGLIIDESSNSTISFNFISGFEIGIFGYSSENTSIQENVIINCLDYGISVHGTNYTILRNFFLDNNNGSVQAYDDSVNSTWYEAYAESGNFWTDFNGTGSYSIDGSANSEDLYPIIARAHVEPYFMVDLFEYGTTDNALTWTITSTLPILEEIPMIYTIYQNGSEVTSGRVSYSNFAYSVDGLAIGVYNFTIVVTDFLNNTAKDTVFITVEDTIKPIVNSPDDLSYSEGETGNTLSWTAMDLDAGTYSIYQDGIEISTGNWISGTVIVLSVDDLSAGNYNFTIVVQDKTGNSASDTVNVEVTEDSDFTLILISITIVIIGGLGVAIYFYLKRDK